MSATIGHRCRAQRARIRCRDRGSPATLPVRFGLEWRKRSFRPAAGAAGLLEWDAERKRWLGDFTPYDLRHTCASLMIAAGRPIAEVADHLGHGVDVCMRTYAHLIDGMKGEPLTPVDDAIRSARAEVSGGGDVGQELGAAGG
jgi:integrase